MNERTPFDVVCPRCGAEIRRRCHTRTGYSSTFHAGRWKAIGIDKPTGDDRARAWAEYERLKHEIIEDRYAKIMVKLTEV